LKEGPLKGGHSLIGWKIEEKFLCTIPEILGGFLFTRVYRFPSAFIKTRGSKGAILRTAKAKESNRKCYYLITI